MAGRGEGYRVGVVGVAEPGASLKQQIEAADAVLVAVFQDLVLRQTVHHDHYDELGRVAGSDCGLNEAREEQDKYCKTTRNHSWEGHSRHRFPAAQAPHPTRG